MPRKLTKRKPVQGGSQFNSETRRKVRPSIVHLSNGRIKWSSKVLFFEGTRLLAFTLVLAILSIGKSQATQIQYTVAQDGSGNFSTISEAIRAAPNNSAHRYNIKIKGGVYHERISIGPEKTNIGLIGEGLEKTIITGDRNNASGYKLKDTATAGIQGSGFTAQGITFQNTAGPEGYQAVALFSEAQNLTFYQCRIAGYQDTLYAAFGHQFYRECEILGTIDFMFGDATAVFQNCIIQARRPLANQYITITAQGKDRNDTVTGFVLQNCTINAAEELREVKDKFRCYLGRPWKNFSRTVIMKSFIDDLINPKGWIEWEGKKPIHPYFAEYQNIGPGANSSGRANWTVTITTTMEASQFTVRNFLGGGRWIPTNIPHYLDLL